MLWPIIIGLMGCGKPEEVPPPPPKPQEEKTSVEYAIDNIDQLKLRPQRAKIFMSPKVGLTEAHQTARETLTNIINDLGRTPDNPWALAHALLALGPNTQTTDGRNGVDVIFTQYSEPYKIGSRQFIRFPRSIQRTNKKIPVESHKDMMLKVFTELNIKPERSYHLHGQIVTFEDYYKGVLLSSYIVPQTNESSYSNHRDIPWSIQGLSAYAPQDLHWRSFNNVAMNMNDMADILASVADGEMAPVLRAYQAGAGIHKNKQNIFAHPCGGSHLLQGLSSTLSRGFGKMLKTESKAKDVMKKQVVLHFYRFPKELEHYDNVLKSNPNERTTLLLQRLKFVGHFLETSAKLAIHGHYKPTPTQMALIKGGMDQLALTLSALEKEGVLANTDELKEKNEQQYLDLIGDSAHALYGLELVSGKRGLWH